MCGLGAGIVRNPVVVHVPAVGNPRAVDTGAGTGQGRGLPQADGTGRKINNGWCAVAGLAPGLAHSRQPHYSQRPEPEPVDRFVHEGFATPAVLNGKQS